MRRRSHFSGALVWICAVLTGCGGESQTAVKEIEGKYYDAGGIPTFKVRRDGGVDWYTFSGYLYFTKTCRVCHGLDATGSTFAPVLANALKTLSYGEFHAIVTAGQRSNAMPAFEQNKTVMCHLDDIYIYLSARAHRAIGPGKPEKHDPKPEAAAKAEDECYGPTWHRQKIAEE